MAIETIANYALRDLELLAIAGKKAADWANHGTTCRGWQGYCRNKAGDRLSYDQIPKGEEFNWWHAFDENQCTCGIKALRAVVWSAPLSKAYSEKEMKMLVGYAATQTEQSNIDALRLEVEMLRAAIEKQAKELDRERSAKEKLERKLRTIAGAAALKDED